MIPESGFYTTIELCTTVHAERRVNLRGIDIEGHIDVLFGDFVGVFAKGGGKKAGFRKVAIGAGCDDGLARRRTVDAVLGEELFNEFQGGFLALDWMGPKITGGNVNDSEETNVAVTTLANSCFRFGTGVEHFREVGWATDKGDIHVESLARNEALSVVGRATMKLGHFRFFAKWAAKVDSRGRDVRDAVDALTGEIEGTGTTMAVSLVPEFKVFEFARQ